MSPAAERNCIEHAEKATKTLRDGSLLCVHHCISSVQEGKKLSPGGTQIAKAGHPPELNKNHALDMCRLLVSCQKRPANLPRTPRTRDPRIAKASEVFRTRVVGWR